VTSKKNLLIVLLALSTVATGVLAWQQHQQALHTVAATSSNNDELLKKLADAERRASDLEARLAALQAAEHGPDMPPAESNAATTTPERRGPDRAGPNNRRAEMAALMNNPEVVKLMAAQQKSMLDNRYAALFKRLNLNPAQLEAFKNLLLEKQNSQRDVMSAARDSGVNPRESRDELRKLVQEANDETDAAIVAAIGQDKFSQYKNYDATGSQRALVDQIGRSLSYSTPLSDAQSQALVQIFAQNSSTDAAKNTQRGGWGGPFGGNNTAITDDMIAQAQSILSADQLKVVQEHQATQQAEAKLREMMRAQNQNGRQGR